MKYKLERDRSIEQIAADIWKLAYDLGFKENTCIPTNHYLAHAVMDFMPAQLSRWMDCRMSIADNLKWTPERVVRRLLAVEYLLTRDHDKLNLKINT